MDSRRQLQASLTRIADAARHSLDRCRDDINAGVEPIDFAIDDAIRKIAEVIDDEQRRLRKAGIL